MLSKINRKGFTLIEVLAAVVILGILAVISIPAVTKSISTSKDKVFFSNVSNVVSDLKKEKVLSNTDKCVFKSDNNIEGVSYLRIIATKDGNNEKYMVLAQMEGTYDDSDDSTLDIITTDFDSLTEDNRTAWKTNGAKDEYNEKLRALSQDWDDYGDCKLD